MDRGTIESDYAFEKFRNENPKLKKEITEIENIWIDYLIPIEKNIKILEKLDEKNELLLLSNFHKKAFEIVEKKYEFFKVFKKRAISCYINKLKPDYEIYDYIIKNFDLNKEETVFIDDTLKNVEAALEYGIKSIHYKYDMNLEKELENI
ncbi:putative hydrolase of the HAD superfamily [Oceanotoga teriensis]|uniref:Hydrolase of the HAD superfamily n=1 Tax=Oceanotoga teriensis TaxID=515440 RepID=A0AA45C7Z6_9BACT|nr:HAD-IA family hydrolase [Oceanotoga teriensis]PWJ95836.1 putative hydrolase of the HAD superfamily [Oceanotoga teriensis]